MGSAALSPEEIERYSRQIPLIGHEGQARLKASSVMVAGLGGLGSAASIYLAAAGVGRLVLVDNGVVELSNLNRQILYGVSDLGKPKPQAAAERLKEINPNVEAIPVYGSVNERLLEAYDVDVYVDAFDNWEARFVLDRVAWRKGKPLVHGGVRGFYGQVTVVKPRETPCLRSLIRQAAREESPLPIFPTTPGIIGLIEALEALKLLLGIGKPLVNRILVYNGLEQSFQVVEFKPTPELIKMCEG